MVFDIEDFLSPEFAPLAEAIILHEMAHVLGIGVLQEPTGVLPFPDSYDITSCLRTGDGRYNSLDGFATAAYLCSGGYIPTALPSSFTRARVPPLETDFGPGTRCGHWDESTLATELMTGFISPGLNPLSIVTIGGFEDLGYVVEYDTADPYTVPVNSSVLSSARTLQGGLQVDEFMKHPALGYTTPGGRQRHGAARNHTSKELHRFRAEHAKKANAAARRKH